MANIGNGMKVGAIVAALGDECRHVLEATRGDRIGTVVPVTPATREGLLALELIGAGDGLTIKGSAVACKLQRELLDRVFG